MTKFFMSVALALTLSATQLVANTLGNPLRDVITTSAQDCRLGSTWNMPIIAWGADGVTLEAVESGAMAQAGVNLSLSVEDNFTNQINAYLRCESPFLRGTLGMLTAAGDVTQADRRTEQVVFYMHSWSLGDGVVGGEGIRTLSDLSGKRIAIQAYGPHLDFLGRILTDAGLSLQDVDLVWTTDLTGEGDTPSNAMIEGRADAAMVILPDARVLTSDGVGTGAEGSVRGARTIFSTLEASSVVGDYISVRRDVFEQNPEQIEAIVRTLFETEEVVREQMAINGSELQNRLSARIADELLDGLPAEEGLFLWQDMISMGWFGNARHFADDNEARRFDNLILEINAVLRDANLIAQPHTLATAQWDYAALAETLTNVSERQIAAFDSTAAAAAVDTLRRTGELDANTQIRFSVYFDPAERTFPVSLYERDFDEIVRLASTYSGAIIVVEGHTDPLEYMRAEQNGVASSELRQLRAVAHNLSVDRANALMESLTEHAQERGQRLTEGQFTVEGVGITNPRFAPPTTEAEWKQNMRVEIRVLRVEAETTTFNPL